MCNAVISHSYSAVDFSHKFKFQLCFVASIKYGSAVFDGQWLRTLMNQIWYKLSITHSALTQNIHISQPVLPGVTAN